MLIAYCVTESIRNCYFLGLIFWRLLLLPQVATIKKADIIYKCLAVSGSMIIA